MAFTLFIFVLGCCLPAKAASAPQNANCKIDNTPPSEADIAFDHGDAKKADALYLADLSKDPKDGRVRVQEIEALQRLHKPEEASKKVADWTSTAPDDPWAILAAAQVHYYQGEWLEFYALALKALKANPCLPEGYADIARFERLSGYRATAHKHIALAHQLAPQNDDIRLSWIDSLNQADSAVELEKYIQESNKSIDDKRRQALVLRLNRERSLQKDHCELSSVTGPARIPMVPMYLPRSSYVQFYGLEVAFNGHKRTLQIDTGAGGFLLTRTATGNTGLVPVDTVKIGGFGNQDASGATLARAATVTIGGLEFKNCIVDELNGYGVMGGSRIQGNRMDANDGLMGTNVFDRYLVTLDYMNHEVRLDPLPAIPGKSEGDVDALGGSVAPDWSDLDRYIAPSMKSWTKIYRSGHLFDVPVVVNQKIPAIFAADTGSQSNLIDTSYAKKFTTAETGIYAMRGLSGTTQMSTAGKFTLDFSGVRLPVKDMDSIDLGGGIQGFLGYPTLSQLVVHLDYRDNLILFEEPAATDITKPR